MKDNWQERISCAIECSKCAKKLNPEDNRILSVYDHQAICFDCKKEDIDLAAFKEKYREILEDAK